MKGNRKLFHCDGVFLDSDISGDSSQAIDEFGIPSQHGSTGSQTVDKTEKLVVVQYGLLIKGVDSGALVELGCHPPLTFERNNRLSNRDPTHTKRLGHLVLRQPHA